MKPYEKIESQNLGLVLFLARFLAVIGVISTAIGLISFLAMVFAFSFMGAIGAGMLVSGIGILLVSAMLAAIVAFEENYRIRTVHLVSKNEI